MATIREIEKFNRQIEILSEAYHTMLAMKCSETIADRWLHDPFTFISDVGFQPKTGFQLERLDKSLGFNSRNFVWVDKRTTNKVSRKGKPTSLFFSHQGKRQTISEWAIELGIPYQTIFKRYKVEKAKARKNGERLNKEAILRGLHERS